MFVASELFFLCDLKLMKKKKVKRNIVRLLDVRVALTDLLS